MKRLYFACAMTALAFSINVCAAQSKAPNELTKTAATAQSIQKIQLNSATLEQLDAIPGLGLKKAQAVLDYIAQNGPIKDQAQLTQVKGIGDKLAAKISPYVSFN